VNEITHPEIYKEMLKAAWNYLLEGLIFDYFLRTRKITRLNLLGHQFIVMDLPLLFESERMLAVLHKIVVVSW
jgi:dephospho-CoA kinase